MIMFPLDSKILIVDDMTSIRELALNTFRELNYLNLHEAKDAAEAWEKIQNEPRPFDLVVCSHKMKNSAGLDLLVRIRRSERFRSLPFLMTGSHSDPEIILESIQSGADHFLIKPFRSIDLADRLETISKKTAGKP